MQGARHAPCARGPRRARVRPTSAAGSFHSSRDRRAGRERRTADNGVSENADAWSGVSHRSRHLLRVNGDCRMGPAAAAATDHRRHLSRVDDAIHVGLRQLASRASACFTKEVFQRNIPSFRSATSTAVPASPDRKPAWISALRASARRRSRSKRESWRRFVPTWASTSERYMFLLTLPVVVAERPARRAPAIRSASR